MARNHSELYSMLFSNLSSVVETWQPLCSDWEIHQTNAVRQVTTDVVLLYRVMPNGIMGDRLQDCPRLDEYIAEQNVSACHAGQKRSRVDAVDEEIGVELKKKSIGLVERRPHAPIGRRSVSRTASHRSTSQNSRTSSHRSLSQTSRPMLDSTSQHSGSRTVSQAISTDHPTTSTHPSHSLHSLSPTPAADADQHLHGVLVPKANNKVQGEGKERAWPGSYYALDVFDIFEKIDAMQEQRVPPVYRKKAFQSVVGIKHYVASTYTKARYTYDHNLKLVTTFRARGRTSASTWNRFVHESRQDRAVSEDNDGQDSGSRRGSSISSIGDDANGAVSGNHRERSVISIEDDDFIQPLEKVAEERDSDSDMDADENEGRDWTMCCFYCDEELPIEPSKELIASGKILYAISQPDKQHTGKDASPNPHHRWVRPIVKTMGYCLRHRFETGNANILSRSWAIALPVCFRSLPARVTSMIPILNHIYNFPMDSEFYSALMDRIRTLGENRALGIAGQYMSLGVASAG